MLGADLQQFQQAVSIAQAGRKEEAHTVLTQLAYTNPNDSNLLLWLAFTATNLSTAHFALTRLRQLDPANPSLPGAESWLLTEEARQPVPTIPTMHFNNVVASPRMGTSFQIEPTTEAQLTPLGPAVQESSNFFMSQTGGLVLVWGIIFLVSLISFVALALAFLNGATQASFIVRGGIYLVISGIIAPISGWFLFAASKDVLSTPLKAQGKVIKRREVRVKLKTRNRGITYEHLDDLQYEIDFMPDGATQSVILKLNEPQYQASQRSNYAFVAYSKNLGTVNTYQPLGYGGAGSEINLSSSGAGYVSPYLPLEGRRKNRLLFMVTGGLLVFMLLIIGAILLAPPDEPRNFADQIAARGLPVYPEARAVAWTQSDYRYWRGEYQKVYSKAGLKEKNLDIGLYRVKNNQTIRINEFYDTEFGKRGWLIASGTGNDLINGPTYRKGATVVLVGIYNSGTNPFSGYNATNLGLGPDEQLLLLIIHE